MAFLLDTHAFIWWLVDQSQLPDVVLGAMQDINSKVFVSAASAMEMTTKHRIGKLPIVNRYINQLSETVARSNFDFLAIEFSDAVAAGRLEFSNRDPFDRL